MSETEIYTPDNPPSARQLARIICRSKTCAWKRIRKWRAGELFWDELFAGKMPFRDAVALVKQRTGLVDSAARARLLRFWRGEITEAQLYAPPRTTVMSLPEDVLRQMSARLRLADIPGPTELERRVLG